MLKRKTPLERPPPVQIPEDGFNHPFLIPESYRAMADEEPGREHPKTVSGDSSCAAPRFLYLFHQIVELRMCALSSHIREKPNWWEKVKDETIVERWRGEALQEDVNERPEWKLTSGMVNLATRLRAAPITLNRTSQGQVRTRGASGIRGFA